MILPTDILAAAERTVVAVPTLDEAAHIESLIEGLLHDPLFSSGGRLWVLDGGSTDATREIVGRVAASDGRVRLLDNPGRNQSAALNLAADLANEARAEILIRLDAHSRYPADFVSGLVRTLISEGCDSVVVPMRTVGGGPMRDAAADLFNSWLGNGGSPHRSGRVRGYVEHGHHAAFRLATFKRVGGYDVRFAANEDAELDKRIVAAGGRIFLDDELTIDYVPRSTLAASWRQMWRNGRYRTWTAFKHGQPLGPRQLAPVAVAGGVLGSAGLGVIWPPLAGPAVAYLALVLVLSVRAATRPTPARIARIASLAVVTHVAFGLGVLRGLVEMTSRSRPRFPQIDRRPSSVASEVKA